MNYVVPGEVLARLLVAAGARLDADEIGEIIHRIKADPGEPASERPSYVVPAEPFPPAKPE